MAGDADLKFEPDLPTVELSLVDDDSANRVPVSSRYDILNEAAIPVEVRAASSFAARTFTVGSSAQMLLGRRRARRFVALSCPGTVTSAGTGSTPEGFTFASDRASAEAGIGFQVNPGDSVTIQSQGDVWVAPLPGNTTGFVQYLEVFDALTGPQAR